jgi:hypothetical protein
MNRPVNFNDPTGHDPIPDFITGLALEIGRTVLWFSPYHQEVGAIQENESDAMLAGRLVADIASAVIGVGAFATGAGGEGGGVLACATGVGCPGGAAAIAVGGALMLQGGGMALRGAEGAGTVLALFASRNNNPTGRRAPWTNQKEKLIERDGPYCVYCGKKLPPNKLTIDHFDPWLEIKKGAQSRLDEIKIYRDTKNLVLSCRSCNSSKWAHKFLYWLAK